MEARKKFLVLVTAAVFLWLGVGHAGTLDVRFCPAEGTWSYPAESQRGVQTVLLQNALVINRGVSTADVTAVDIELMNSGTVLDIRHIESADLKKLAAAGSQLQSAGLLRLLSFQFCGDQLIPAGTVLSGPTLKPGEGLLIMAEPFVYPGTREMLRVRVTAKSGTATVGGEGSEAIRNGTAKVRFRFPLNGTWYGGEWSGLLYGPSLGIAGGVWLRFGSAGQ
jgi:hypothetical protein